MSGFLSPLRLEFIDGSKWRVLKPFEYHLGAPDSDEVIVVPSGFLTDFASIPRGLWNLLPPTGLYGKAAVLHDWLYQHRTVTVIARPPRVRLVDRGEADHVLKEAMEVLGVGRMTRWTIYAGIRAGGWLTWRRYRKAEQA